MNECRYRIGDAVLSAAVFMCLIGMSIALGATEHWAWFTPGGFLLVVYIFGALMNRRERRLEAIQQIRQQRQLALGVPPDEAMQ